MGTNKWRGFENITMIGSFNKPLSTDSDAAAEAWQFLMRGAGRTGSYCLVNWWVGTHTLPAALEWFPQWDNIKSVMPQCRYWYRSYDYVDGKLHLRQEATEDLASFKESEKEACEKYGVMQSYDPNYQEKRLKYAEMTMNDCVENYNNPKCDTKKRERIMARLRDLLGLESAREVRAKLKDMGIELADSRGQSLNTWKNLVK